MKMSAAVHKASDVGAQHCMWSMFSSSTNTCSGRAGEQMRWLTPALPCNVLRRRRVVKTGGGQSLRLTRHVVRVKRSIMSLRVIFSSLLTSHFLNMVPLISMNAIAINSPSCGARLDRGIGILGCHYLFTRQYCAAI